MPEEEVTVGEVSSESEQDPIQTDETGSLNPQEEEIILLKDELRWEKDLNRELRARIQYFTELVGTPYNFKRLWYQFRRIMRRAAKHIYLDIKVVVQRKRCVECRKLKLTTRRREVEYIHRKYYFCSPCAARATEQYGYNLLVTELQ